MWPSVFIMIKTPFQSLLYACLALLLVTAEALQGITSTSVGVPALQDLQHVFHSAAGNLTSLIRQRFLRIIHGQLGYVDMVLLIAACGIIQGLRLWRGQPVTQRNEGEIRDVGSPNHQASRTDRGCGVGATSLSGKHID